MKTTERLERAITKLYKAYHEDRLHPEKCKSCAVGNICNNTDDWKYFTDVHGSMKLSYVGRVNQGFGRKHYGYTPKELLEIEAVFLDGCGYGIPIQFGSKKPENPTDKDVLFNGLCAVIGYLCELDHVPNVMDYTMLFEVESDLPKYELPEFH